MVIIPHNALWAIKRVIAALIVIGISALLGFVVLGFISIQVWEVTNSPSFCTETCHDVHPEEPIAYQDSYHAQVRCTECHMGRVSTLQAMALKTTHARHLPQVILELYERPLRSTSMRPADKTCERCHTPSAVHDDTAREIRRFLPDGENSEKRTYLLLRTGTGSSEPEKGYGIHWHISNQVDYIALDDQNQEIRWVRATLPDGQVVEYNDVRNPLSAADIEAAEKRTMDCVDCHNRVGHPFPSPETLIDQALAEGRLGRDLPFAKREMLRLLSADYASQSAALSAADALTARYQDAYPEVAGARPTEIEQAVKLAKELIPRLVFMESGISWNSFPDNDGHRSNLGCFRCHDGSHLNQEGEPIRLSCILCHSIPLTKDASDNPPEVPLASRQAPATHMEATFISDHRYQANEACTDCHGEIQFGDDDSSFCANSACHGQDWPMVDLDILFPHPIQLVGGHAETACYTCHKGARGISPDCGTCHEPPDTPHYGTACTECHTPSGFTAARADRFGHPVPLEGRHANLSCDSCHTGDGSLRSDCAACHPAPADHLSGSCSACHTPAGWTESAVYSVAMGGEIPHEWLPGDDCKLCHDPFGPNWPAPAKHIPFDTDQCTLCHAPGGGERVTASHAQVPGLLQGQHARLACIQCHEDGHFQGTPHACLTCHQDADRHGGQLGRDCAACHSTGGWAGASIDHNRTAFPLTGAHASAACTQCHADGTYAGTPQSCYACHQADDRHGGQVGQDCAACHSTGGWAGASIDHNRTAFPLTGAHAGTACTQCHADGTYAGTPQSCYACHQADDRHGSRLGQDCAACHSTGGWAGASIDHNRTAFPLTGAHASAACTQCHADGTYAGTPQSCYACHQADDRHGGQLGQDCAACHSTGGWAGASIDHSRTAFPLTGAHAGAACTQCHADGTYAGTAKVCVACHGEPSYHAGQLGPECASCHNTGGWLPASYNRAHTFPLGHEGAASTCRTCHPERLSAYTCYTCHSTNGIAEEHRDEVGSDYSNCVACHPAGREP
jgi:hypothetical protein